MAGWEPFSQCQGLHNVLRTLNTGQETRKYFKSPHITHPMDLYHHTDHMVARRYLQRQRNAALFYAGALGDRINSHIGHFWSFGGDAK